MFIPDSYANRVGKGTHAAVDRVQALARRYRFVLRADIVKHFPSIDHAILSETLARVIPEPDVMYVIAGYLIREQQIRGQRISGWGRHTPHETR